MKKKMINILLLLFLSMFLLSASTTYKQITAYKYSSTGDLPNPNYYLRILNPSNVQLNDSGSSIQIPTFARTYETDIFSWSFSGNIYGDVSVEFIVSPMKEEKSSHYLPFYITFQSVNTKVGDIQIPYYDSSNPTYNSEVPYTIDGSNYKMKYAESIFINDSAIAETSFENAKQTLTFVIDTLTNQTVKINYNMETGSQILDNNGNDVNDYSYDVCNQWNRNGKAILKIEYGDGEFTSGRYFSDVTVSLTTGG